MGCIGPEDAVALAGLDLPGLAVDHDEATAAGLLAEPRLKDLGLDQVAPGILVATASAGQVLRELRATGLAPVTEDASGHLVVGPATAQQARRAPESTLGWGIILGSIPVAAVGLLFKDFIEGPVRSLWVIAGALIIWSGAMWLADHQQNLTKGMKDVTVKDALIIGAFQALAPVFPGISRSGATISAGLFLKFDRVTATRLSFYMGIPSLVAAGLLEAATEASTISNTVGWTPTIVATVVSGVVAYATIAWLLRFVSSNKFTSFLVYRVLLGLIIIALVAAGTIAA